MFVGFDRDGKRVVRVQNPRNEFLSKNPLLADYLLLRATASWDLAADNYPATVARSRGVSSAICQTNSAIDFWLPPQNKNSPTFEQSSEIFRYLATVYRYPTSHVDVAQDG